MAVHASDTLPAVPDRPVLDLLLGDVVRLRRAHPCGGDTWLVDRLGADIGLRCQTCDRHVLIERADARATARRASSSAATRRSPPRSWATAASDDGPRPTGPRDRPGVPLEAEARVDPTARATPPAEGALAVFRNPSFLRLWLSQAATQIGGNMVLFGLTVIVSETQPNTAVSLLILSFLVPAVLFSAVAGRLRRPDRPAARADRDQRPARRWRSSGCSSSATTSCCCCC